MDDQTKSSSLLGLPPEDEEWLVFLRDEGLELLSVYRSIRDKSQRKLLTELTKAIAGEQAESASS